MSDKIENDLKEDQQHNDYGQFYKDVFNAATQAGAQSSDIANRATKALTDKGLLPGITITDVDKTGIHITDTQTGTGKTEHYTLDPDGSGIARAEGKIQAIFTPDGKVQRFNYDDAGNLIEVIDADQKSHKDPAELKKFNLDQKTGVITITNDDHSVETYKPDGSSVTTDKNGDVTHVMYAFDKDGHRTARDFEMDPDTHQPKKVTVYDPSVKPGEPDPTKSTWEKAKDGTWTGTVPDGKGGTKTVHSDADFVVGKDGSVIIANRDGSSEKYLPNGSSSQKLADGTTVERNKDRQVEKVVYPDKKEATIKYDSRGQATEVKDHGGVTYTLKDGKWQSDLPGAQPVTDVKVQEDGSIAFTNADKTKRIEKSDGTTVDFDANGRATRVADQTGKISQVYTYNPDGTIKSFALANGKTYTSDGKGTWTDQDKQSINGKARVDQFGTLIFEDSNGTTTYNNTDGSKFIVNKDGSGVQTDKNDRVTRIAYADGGSGFVKRNAAGDATDLYLPDGHWSLGANNKWTKVDGNNNSVETADKVSVDSHGNITIQAAGEPPRLITLKKYDTNPTVGISAN